MDFKSAIEQLKTNGRIDNYECDSRLEEHFIAIANKDGVEHLGEPQDKVEELLQLIAMSESLGGGAAGGGAAELFNIAEVDPNVEGSKAIIKEAHDSGKKLIFIETGYGADFVTELVGYKEKEDGSAIGVYYYTMGTTRLDDRPALQYRVYEM